MAIIKSLLLNILTGATAAVAAALVVVAYSDHLHPTDHPMLACAGMALPVFLVVDVILLMLWLMLRWRRAWIPLLGLILSYPAVRVYLPLHLSSEPPEGSIKVMSYNVAIYGYREKCDNPLDSILAYLHRQQADIVCLQEDVSFKYHPFDSLKALYAYADTVHLNLPASPIINALGLYSRFPIISHERISYDSKANGSVAFFVQIGADTVIVINNHLESTHLSESDRRHYNDILNGDMNSQDAKAETRMLYGKLSTSMALRAPQAEAVHRYVEAHGNYPIILCGDFNDSPISYARRTIAQNLTDCYVESGSGPGISFSRRGFFFRIDHMMCSSHFEPYNCRVDDQIEASDHYPIVCWLKRKEQND